MVIGKSHCIRGHEYTPENTRWKKGGGKDCRRCNLEVWTKTEQAKARHAAERRKQRAKWSPERKAQEAAKHREYSRQHYLSVRKPQQQAERAIRRAEREANQPFKAQDPWTKRLYQVMGSAAARASRASHDEWDKRLASIMSSLSSRKRMRSGGESIYTRKDCNTWAAAIRIAWDTADRRAALAKARLADPWTDMLARKVESLKSRKRRLPRSA